MRILVISDIHANLTALEAVLQDAGRVDGVWCLGDLVGYGPDPDAVVTHIRSLPNLVCVAGNHDVAIADESTNIAIFNPLARESVLWQRRQLSPENRDFLFNLPREGLLVEQVTLVHGSVRDPIWEYILNPVVAGRNMDVMPASLAFCGHTHVQAGFVPGRIRPKMEIFSPGQKVPCQERRMILNPGSVGQPRDEDPRAAYAIFETEERWWMPQRVAYDIEAVQERIRAAGLPRRHADRLSAGR